MQGDSQPPQSAQGLRGSQHSTQDTWGTQGPRAGLNAPPQRPQKARSQAQASNDPEDINGLLDGLLAFIPANNKPAAQGLIDEIAARHQRARSPLGGQETITVASLQKAVTEAVQAAVKATVSTPQARTWADVASGSLAGTPGTIQASPRKLVPQRANREILIRGNSLPADLAKRTPAEITQAINQTTSQQGAIAARKLPSGDTVVTFKDVAAKEWHSKNNQWIQQAFGEQAKEACKTFAVLVKGLRRDDLQGVTEEAFGKEIGLRAVDKVKFRLPSNQGYTRATVLVTLTSLEEACKACDQGIVWNAQLFDCEPYWAVLEPKQCFKCWKWGHIQRYCRKLALCGRCGARAHGEGGKAGEAQCPTHSGRLACRCPTCGGNHPAWDRECRGRTRAREEAREAYQYRPRAFEAPQKEPSTRPPQWAFTTPQEDEEGYQRVGSKRLRAQPRGRPTYLAVAGRDPSQTRLSLGLGTPSTFGTQTSQASQGQDQPQPQPQLPPQSLQDDTPMVDDS
jgi:hypothetical protein